MKINFDKKINRKNTNSVKWDLCEQIFHKSDIIPLWVADMDFESPPEIVNEIKKKAEHGIFGYTTVNENLNKAFIKWERLRNDFEVNEKWIVHSPGVVSSLITAIQSFTKENDKILIQTPVYHPFFSTIEENKRTLVKEPLLINNKNITIDFKNLENQLKNDVKMMILCSPHNPIGKVWSFEELSKIINLCEKYNVLLVSDEIHSDLIFNSAKHLPTLNVAKNKNNIISLYSPTKTFNIAGLSESIAIIPNIEHKKKFIQTMNKNGSNMLNIFGLIAAESAYTHGENWLNQLIEYLEKNLYFIIEYFEKNIPQIKIIKPDATYLVWLDCKGLNIDDDKINKFFVDTANIGLNDGKTFGVEGKGFQRLNFACNREILTKALVNIKNAVEKL